MIQHEFEELLEQFSQDELNEKSTVKGQFTSYITRRMEWHAIRYAAKNRPNVIVISLEQAPRHLTDIDAEQKLKGFPLCGRCNIQRDCKVRPIQKYMKSLLQDTQQYVGLATDEQDRLMRLQEKQISLLEQYACSESEAWELCHRYGLLSPVYDFTDRNGCWFCPNAKLPELRHLYDHHPDLWREMLALQALPNKATEKFNRELRFSDYDILFHNEDAQLCWFTQ